MQPSDLQVEIATLAKRAGAEILQVYSQPFDVTRKEDQSPLTQADLRAHTLIIRKLSELTPDVPVLSEEASDVPFETRQHWQRYWLVDPLDGTKEFVSRNGEFTVNIALIERHAPVLGVVHVPVKGTTYVGSADGAFKQIGEKHYTPIRVRTPAAMPVRVVGSRSHAAPGSLDTILEQIGPHTLLSVGSSLKFCLIAEGSADFYPRFGPTSEWDTAAAQAVVEAAGGAVVDVEGKPLRYNLKAHFLNPNFLVFGDRNRRWPGVKIQ